MLGLELTLYLGCPEPGWLPRTELPLFVSYNRLRTRKSLPKSHWRGQWALDSGGYMRLRQAGTWDGIPAHQYLADVLRYDEEIGNLSWVAPQDWMCEPDVLAITGLTVLEHQRRTVANFVRLVELWAESPLGDYECAVMPVLQGDPELPVDELIASYMRCWDMYSEAGFVLADWPVVGLGSVCRQQSTEKIVHLVQALHDRDPDVRLHGFGCKSLGLQRVGHLLASADSQAWSFAARRKKIKHPDCIRSGAQHKNCASCLVQARQWYGDLTSRLLQQQYQQDLFSEVPA